MYLRTISTIIFSVGERSTVHMVNLSLKDIFETVPLIGDVGDLQRIDSPIFEDMVVDTCCRSESCVATNGCPCGAENGLP